MDVRKRQTFTASPAKPGDFSIGLSNHLPRSQEIVAPSEKQVVACIVERSFFSGNQSIEWLFPCPRLCLAPCLRPPDPSCLMLPVMGGSVSAGFPSPAEDWGKIMSI